MSPLVLPYHTQQPARSTDFPARITNLVATKLHLGTAAFVPSINTPLSTLLFY